jgi:hypothetical protein
MGDFGVMTRVMLSKVIAQVRDDRLPAGDVLQVDAYKIDQRHIPDPTAAELGL